KRTARTSSLRGTGGQLVMRDLSRRSSAGRCTSARQRFASAQYRACRKLHDTHTNLPRRPRGQCATMFYQPRTYRKLSSDEQIVASRFSRLQSTPGREDGDRLGRTKEDRCTRISRCEAEAVTIR